MYNARTTVKIIFGIFAERVILGALAICSHHKHYVSRYVNLLHYGDHVTMYIGKNMLYALNISKMYLKYF